MSSKMASEAEVTVVVVGDARVGKTALIRRVTQGEFSQVRRRIGYHSISARHLYYSFAFLLLLPAHTFPLS